MEHFYKAPVSRSYIEKVPIIYRTRILQKTWLYGLWVIYGVL